MHESGDRDKSRRHTDELLQHGAKPLGGQDSAPFVHWPNDYAYVEGADLGFWDGPYGRVCRLLIQDLSAGLTGTTGKGDGRVDVPLSAGMEVNIGLSYAGLRVIVDRLAGKSGHIAFIGWGETGDGSRFRRFQVIPLPDERPAEEESVQGNLSL